MTFNPKNLGQNPAFGPVRDEQADYWQRSSLQIRDRELLDRHFQSRFSGQRFPGGQDPTVRAFAIPKSQQVALQESPRGGIPSIAGGSQVWDPRYLDAQSRMAQNLTSLPSYSENREVNAGAVLYQRAVAKMAQPAPEVHGPVPGHALATGQQSFQQPPPALCQLAEGSVFYNALQVNFGGTMPLVKRAGQLSGIQGRQFQVEGVTQCYCVDGLQTVDLQNPDQQRMIQLVRVSSGMMGGSILVPQQAVVEMSNQTNRTLLMDDGRQARRVPVLSQQPQVQRPVIQSQPQRPALLVNQQARPQTSLQQQSMDLLRRRGLLRG